MVTDRLLVRDEDRAVARAVLYTAADYNTGFAAAPDDVVEAWAKVLCIGIHDGLRTHYRRWWLTIDLAEQAVREHFAKSTDGHMVPGDIIHHADLLRQKGSAKK
ncbi:hypothetical protein [Nocardia sp. BMG51109]|uniref:hypothetical protein n=1 Tax=Nocardia sp. BMG51109 TaxID=1056816 RepID=UPI000467296B|nr:hypothetical protein [Nocardia sp. BMG51109]